MMWDSGMGPNRGRSSVDTASRMAELPNAFLHCASELQSVYQQDLITSAVPFLPNYVFYLPRQLR